MFRAGIEIKLKDGWHTYWRYPGDSGVPPVLDFSKSQNVKTVTVLYPAPHAFPMAPAAIRSATRATWSGRFMSWRRIAGKPVTLDLKLDYAVCEKLCVPAEGRGWSLSLSGVGAADGWDARRRRGESAEAGQDRRRAASSPSARCIARPAAGKPRIVVDVAADAPVTLFAEGPTPQWALPLPEPVAGAPAGLQRFAFELDGLPPGEKAEGATLRLTAVSGDKAIEVAFRLD